VITYAAGPIRDPWSVPAVMDFAAMTPDHRIRCSVSDRREHHPSSCIQCLECPADQVCLTERVAHHVDCFAETQRDDSDNSGLDKSMLVIV